MTLKSLVSAGLLGAACIGSAVAQAAYDIGSEANFGQVKNFQHGSVYYMGHVKIAGDAAPWDPIPVAAVCNGVTRMNTLTDVKGEFRLQPPPTVSEMGVSANDPNRVVAASLAGCKAKAKLEGFESTELNIISNTIMDNPDLGTITLKRDEKSPGAAVSATTFSAPPEVQKEFERARSEAFGHRPDAATRILQNVVIEDPKFAEAWYQLGRLQEASQPDAALRSFNQAVAADPDFISPYVHIASIYATQKNWEASLAAVRQSLKLYPWGSPQVWYFSALANLNLNHPHFAETSSRAALEIDPSHFAPNTEQLLAIVLAGRGDYAEALQHLRSSLTYIPPGPNADLIRKQIAQVERAQTAAAAKQPTHPQ
jgi:tetratricopeptide (TPR) repeat protein